MVAIGLGNPGPRYDGTRHSIGFAVVDRAAARLGLEWKRPLFRRFAVARGAAQAAFVKPLTYMNRSGEVLREVLVRLRASLADVIVVYDSLDLPAGQCRLRTQGSSGGHKGLESIERSAGTTAFARLAVGIGRPAAKSDIVSYVLERPTGNEAEALARAVERAADVLLRLPVEGVQRMMNEVNRKVPAQG